MFRISFFVAVLSVFASTLSAQSPWVRSKAGFYAQLSAQFIPTYGAVFGPEDQPVYLQREVSERALQFYGEYGVTKNTGLVISAPLRQNKRGNLGPNRDIRLGVGQSGSLTQFGNVSLAIKHRFYQKKYAVAGTLRVELPASAPRSIDGLAVGYNAYTVEPILSVGRGFDMIYAYAFTGYGARTGDYSHFWRAGVEAGVHLGDFWFIVNVESLNSLKNGLAPVFNPENFTGLYINDQEWVSVGIKGIYEFNRFSGLIASYGGAASAHWAPQSPSMGIGGYFKWD